MVRGTVVITDMVPNRIEITSLFTYAWKPVHQAIEFYHKQFPDAEIHVGGIYASLLPDEITTEYPYVKIHKGLNAQAEKFMPNYDILKTIEKWKGWDGSILFTSRGCINKCPFCMVPTMEGDLRNVLLDPSFHVHPEHKNIIIWDNNFLALPDWKNKLDKLAPLNKTVDFNQGLDARLMTEEKAKALSELKIRDMRMAYDGLHEKKAVHRAVRMLDSAGFDRRRISFYALYNFYDYESDFYDTPEEFYERVIDIMDLGCVTYPMRFVPFNTKTKNEFVSPLWKPNQLEAVAKARRVIGFGGSFPPYSALVQKFKKAGSFDEAFRLEERKRETSTSTKMMMACDLPL
ncbi:MAG: hypothetical protein FWG96_03755 [Methanomassiliicoccaceae archaeon]|nr:hypothetical protein [Methanomassiliicoccaceae archaeon]